MIKRFINPRIVLAIAEMATDLSQFRKYPLIPQPLLPKQEKGSKKRLLRSITLH